MQAQRLGLVRRSGDCLVVLASYSSCAQPTTSSLFFLWSSGFFVGRRPAFAAHRGRDLVCVCRRRPKRTEEGGDTVSAPLSVRENRSVGGVKGPKRVYAGRGSRVHSTIRLEKRTEEGGDTLSASLSVREN